MRCVGVLPSADVRRTDLRAGRDGVDGASSAVALSVVPLASSDSVADVCALLIRS